MLRRTFFALAVLVAAAHAQEAPSAEEARFIANARQLIFEGKRSGEGYFSPDGKKLIFQSERDAANPFYQIYVLDLETGDTSRVSPGTGKTTCAFFVPGQPWVIFASTHADPQAAAKQKAELEFRESGKTRRYSWDYDSHMGIYAASLDGKQVLPLTNSPGYSAEGSVSPDGQEIVFCSLRSAFPMSELSPEQRKQFDTNPLELVEAKDRARFEKDPAWFGEIYVMKRDGSDVRRLTNDPGYDGGPFFSPNGERIVWRHFDESGMFADVWTMKRDGSDKRRLTDFKSMSWAPYFHPNGKYLIFTSNKLGFDDFELFIVDAEGTHEPVRVSFTPGFDGLPVFSPDGKKLAWTSGRTGDGKSQIFMADWNDAAAQAALAAAPLRATAGAGAPKAAGTGSADSTPKVAPGVLGAIPKSGPLGLKSEISADDLKQETGFLADDAHEGRATGSPGAQLASAWIADYFKANGLQPLPGSADFFNGFQFNAGEKLIPGENTLVATGLKASADWAVDTDFRPVAFTENGTVSGEVVFAGYGLNVPEAPGQRRYNSYEGLDVKDKIVLLLRYVPEAVEAPRRAYLNRYAGIRYKVMMARERGAKGVLIVTGPNSPNAGELLPFSGDGSSAGSGVVAASLSAKAADQLLTATGKTLKELQTALDDENPHAEVPSAIPGVKLSFRAGVEHIKKSDRNVVGYLPRTTKDGPEEWVIVGAHYDHLGRGDSAGSSLARAGEQGQIHHGADDNASGTAFVMEMAASLAAERVQHPEKFRRNVVFCLWSGEEMGLLGSASFAEKPPFDLAGAVAYLNADMVGRLRDNKLLVQGVGSSKAWAKLVEKRNVAAGFAITLQEDPYLPTDVTSFYPRRVPVLNFFTGSHEDYHRPTDTADKLNIEGLERITKFAAGIVLDVTQMPERIDFSRMERKETGGNRDNLRAYLGSIPDYSGEVKGVKLSGVRPGSPAEKAGVQGGDVVVEFAGQKILNIYDYTAALDAVKIGQPVKMVVERAGKRVEITAIPEARK